MSRHVLKVTRSDSMRHQPKRRLRPGADAAVDGRKWSKSFARWIWARSLYIMVLAGLLWLIFYLTSSPDFEITDVSVKGNNLTRSEDILRLAALQDQPIMLASARGAEDAIRSLKPVQAAKIRLEFPHRAIIEVTERPASYVWKVHDTLLLVSADGIVLGTTPTVNQPVALVDVDGKDLAVGDTVDVDALKTANTLRGLLPSALGLTPAYFEYSGAEGVVLPTDFAGRVVFGSSDDLGNKVAVLKAMKQTIQEQKLAVKYLDLRFQDKPYFR